MAAFTTHAVFISASLLPGLRALPLLDGDSPRYLRVATNVVRHGAISIDEEAPFRWEADRPPGYPLLIALSLKVTGDERWTLYAAALSAAGAAWAAVTLVGLWGGSRLSAHIAGALVALLPNSLGLSAMLLTDAIFGHCMLLWFCLLYLSLKAPRRATVAGSVLVLAFLQTLRPQLLIFAPGLVVLAVVLLGERSRRTAVASVMLVASLLVPAYLTFRVYRDHGVMTPSMVGARSAREYLQARFVAEQEHSEFVIARDRVRREDLASAQRLSTPESLMARRYLVTRAQVASFVRSHPFDIARLMFTEATRQLIAPQEFAVTVFARRPAGVVRAGGVLLTLLLWLLVCVGCYVLPDKRTALFVLGIIAFYLVTGSLSHMVGGRLRFPADMTALPLMALGAGYLISVLAAREPSAALQRHAERREAVTG